MVAQIPVALQLFSVRDDFAKQPWKTLEAVKDIGYQGVEFYGDWDIPAREWRKKLDQLGLEIAGYHVGYHHFSDEALARTIDYHLDLGNRSLICPGIPEQERSDANGWLRCARKFSDVAARLREHGLVTGYHNHSVEFQPVPGSSKLPIDLFFETTSPDVVMQIDVGNAMQGKGRPVDVIRRYPGRTKSVHLKEHSERDEKALLGEGDVPWRELFEACETVGGTEWYIVEQESYRFPPFECARRCLQNLTAMGR